jgi:hypothetical protein
VHVTSSHRHGAMPPEHGCLLICTVASSHLHREISKRHAAMFPRSPWSLSPSTIRSFPRPSIYRRDHGTSRRHGTSSPDRASILPCHAWISNRPSLISQRRSSISPRSAWILPSAASMGSPIFAFFSPAYTLSSRRRTCSHRASEKPWDGGPAPSHDGAVPSDGEAIRQDGHAVLYKECAIWNVRFLCVRAG